MFNRHLRPALILSLILLSCSCLHSQQVDFAKEIKPLLSDRCYTCHGPDAETREADLRLDQPDGIKSVVTAGKISDSELWHRITSEDEDDVMPPADSNLKLSDAEKQLLKRWIEQGARWDQHWSFVRLPKTIKVPAVRSRWPKNEIDHFVLNKLIQRKLDPQSRASAEKLIRRLSFDITGLPPTIKEIDEFLADKSPNAYEKLVDRLLASPRFGERMTSDWLDLARYSDTYGYQVDRDRYVWPWRDWVIRAFNENKPYNQFLIEQLAGDLLPQATQQQKLATTFNRLHPQKVEGGSDPEEFRVEYVADRTQTFATGVLGLTMECARCHDHKYDPLSQKEYYELFAFFDDIDEAGLYSFFTNSVPTPTLNLVSDAVQQQIQKLIKTRRAAETALTKLKSSKPLNKRFQGWLKTNPTVAAPKPIKHLDFDKYKPNPNRENKLVDGRDATAGKAIQLSGDDAVGVGVGNFNRAQSFSVSTWLKIPDYKERAVVFHRSRAWTDAASRGYQLLIENGKLSFSLIHFWPGNAIRVLTQEPAATKKWFHVAITYDGSSNADGIRIYIDGVRVKTHTVRDRLTKNITGGGGNNITIGERFRDRGFTGGQVDDFKVFDVRLTALQVLTDYQGKSISTRLNTADMNIWRDHFVESVDETVKSKRNEVRVARKTLYDRQNKLTEIMVMQQTPQHKQAYVLKRGVYTERGEKVYAAVPETLASVVAFKKIPVSKKTSDSMKAQATRLDLAKWVTHPDHPLTARVAVNRIWQMLFDNGLVRTPEDFGNQGEPPTHPELLDWLARDFVEHNWDVKRLIKKIVMSATYQQKSAESDAAKLKDPENLWLSHFPRSRLPGEAIRDNALAISGILNEKIGGRPAKPYEVSKSFKPVGHDRGPNLYRRSLYTYWKRTGPAPVMMTLDAAKRDVCRVKRQRTNSPLQALVLLNDPQIVEACRVLAEKLIAQHGDSTEKIIRDAFRLVTSRRANDSEIKIIEKLFEFQLKRFKADQDAAAKFLKTGQRKANEKIEPERLAAMTLVMVTLLNHDESIRRY